MSLIETSFRFGRIQSSLRRLGMSMTRRGSTSTNAETVPRIANYRNLFNIRSQSRPTLEDLHEPVARSQIVSWLYHLKTGKCCLLISPNSKTSWMESRRNKNPLETSLAGLKECSSATCWVSGVSCFSSAFLGWLLSQEFVSGQPVYLSLIRTRCWINCLEQIFRANADYNSHFYIYNINDSSFHVGHCY